jgi:hypothetical protein
VLTTGLTLTRCIAVPACGDSCEKQFIFLTSAFISQDEMKNFMTVIAGGIYKNPHPYALLNEFFFFRLCQDLRPGFFKFISRNDQEKLNNCKESIF